MPDRAIAHTMQGMPFLAERRFMGCFEDVAPHEAR